MTLKTVGKYISATTCISSLIVPPLPISLLLCVCANVCLCVCRYVKERKKVLFSLLAVSAGELPYWEKREKLPKHANCYSKGRIN